jgi:hypothetical protein
MVNRRTVAGVASGLGGRLILTRKQGFLALIALVITTAWLLFAPGAASAATFRCFYASDGTIFRCSAPATEFPWVFERAWTRSPEATLTTGYPLYNEPAVTGWRWNGNAWSAVSIDHATQCYKAGANCWHYRWGNGWSWYWEARFGWLAVRTSQIELDIPQTYLVGAVKGQCFPGREIPPDIAPQDARTPTAMSCQFSR